MAEKKNYRWRDENFYARVGNEVNRRIEAYQENYNTLQKDYQERNTGRKYTYEDAYVSDSADWANSVAQRRRELDAEADGISAYIDRFADGLDANWVKQIKSGLTDTKKYQGMIADAATKDHEWWSGFASDDLVKKHGSAEEAYKYYQQSDGFHKKYAGKTYTELQKILSDLEEGSEKDWLASYAASVDYDEKSKYDVSFGEYEIKSLENKIQGLENAYFMYHDILDNPEYADMDAYNQKVAELFGKYGGSPRAMDKYIRDQEALLEEKRRYHNEAKYIQDGIALANVSQNDDFEKYSGYATTKNDGWWDRLWSDYGMGYEDLTYEYINNQNGIRDDIQQKYTVMSGDRFFLQSENDFKVKGYDHLTEKEIAVYNYYYSKEGKDAAENYLEHLAPTLKARKNAKAAESAAEFAKKHPLWGSVASVGASLGSGAEYIGDVMRYGVELLSGKKAQMDTNTLALQSGVIRATVSNEVDWMISNWDAFDFIYNTTMSGIDSTAASLAFGGFGGAVLGLSAAASATNDALERGMSSGQAFWNGIAAGTFEGLFESLSIGNFRSLKEVDPKHLKDIIKNLGKSMLVNASEESLTEIANIAYDTLVNGEFANYTLEELKNGAWKDAALQVLEAGASGALMGVGMGGIGQTIGYLNNRKSTSTKTTENGGESPAMVQQPAAMKPVTGVKGKNTAQAVAATLDADAIKQTGAVQEGAAAQDAGQTATQAQERSGQMESDADRSRVETAQEFADDDLPFTFGEEAVTETAEGGSDGYRALENRVDRLYSVSDSGKTELAYTGEEVTIDRIESIQGGRMRIRLTDGRVVDASEIAYASDSEAYLYAAVGKIEHITAGDATAITRDYDASSGQTVGEYLNGVDEAYTYGYYGYKEADLQAGDFTGALTGVQKKSAYVLGQLSRNSSENAKAEKHKKMRTAAEAKKKVDNSSADDENSHTEKKKRGEQNDNGRVRKESAPSAEDQNVHLQAEGDDRSGDTGEAGRGTSNGRRYSGHAGKSQVSEGERTQSAKVSTQLGRRLGGRIRSIVDTHISKSANYDEIFGVLCREVGKSEDEITSSELRKAIRQISERLYSDAVNLHSVIFEDRWGYMGEVTKLRLALLEVAQEDSVAQKGKQTAKRGAEPTITYNEGNGKVVPFDEAGIQLTPKQEGGVAVVKILHKLGLGTKFEFFSSYLSETLKDENGDPLRMYLDDEGAERSAYSGIYRMGDGTIRIDLEAYDGSGLTLNAVAHELTHFIQEWSDEKYRVLGDFLIKAYEKSGMTMHKRVLREQKRLESHRREKVSYAEAYDEVVANAMMKMLDDGSLMERLTELKAKDHDLAKKLWEGFKRILGKFTSVYEKESALFHDTADLMAMKDAFEQLQGMFAEALVEASENYQAAVAVGETQKNPTADGGVRYSINSKFYEQLDNWDGKTIGFSFVIGETSQALQEAGIPQKQIRWDASKISTLLAKHSGMTIETVREIPELLENPVIVVDSKKGSNAKIVMGDLRDANGKVVTAVLLLTPTSKKGNVLDLVKISSAEGRSHIKSLFTNEDGTAVPIRYVDKKRIQSWLNVNGLQLPLHNLDSDSNNIISVQTGKSNTKFSLTSTASAKAAENANQKYLDAVSRGDMQAAQQMVDEAAKAAGYTIKAYHGTTNREEKSSWNNQTRSWDTEYSRITVFKKQYEEQVGHFFNSDMDNAGGYGSDLYTVYLMLKKPLVIDCRGQNYASITFDGKERDTYEWAAYAKKNRYDGVVFENISDGVGYDDLQRLTTDYVVFDSNRIKSADPVTYDNKGDVIPLSERFNVTNRDIRYSGHSTDSISNRALLANALEGITRSSAEYAQIQEYKGHIAELDRLQGTLRKLNASIREIRFGTGPLDTERLKSLEKRAREIADEIDKHDRILVSLEATEALRGVIQRERKKAAQKTREHVAAIQQGRKESAERTQIRHQIRRTVNDLDKLLKKGNKKRNVKEDMKGFVSKALELADYLMTDHISDEDLIRKGITVDLRGKEPALVRQTKEILSKLYDHADSLTDQEFTQLDARRKENLYKLREVLTAQRNEYMRFSAYNLFEGLATEYAKLKDAGQDAVKGAYDPEIEKFLRSYLGNKGDGTTDRGRETLLQNMRVADMTTEELWKLHNAYKMVLHAVRTANQLFIKGKNETIDRTAQKICEELEQRKVPDKKALLALNKLANQIGWDYEKLYYALDRIGSDALTELVMNVADSENIVMQDVIEAVEFRDAMLKKYGYNDWAVNKELDREFLDNTGKKFKLTLGQIMTLYAYSKREGAWKHLEVGGFVFGKAALTNPKPADSYKLTREQVEALTGLLTTEQKQYADAMQKFLSDVMGAKGNEVSMMLYGIEMYGEKNYFPIHVAGQYMAQAQEAQAKAAEGFKSMVNAGFTHERNPDATTPIVMEGFMDIWCDHVNEMSRYHGTVPALEDMRKVLNFSAKADAAVDSSSVQAALENTFGKEAVNYLTALYRETNSGAVRDKLEKRSHKLLSLFRKSSVAYSLSVLIQQPSAIVRAYAMIDRKFFGVKGMLPITLGVAKIVGNKWTKAHTNAYNEMLRYAPGVTLAKEIGGFDTHTGASIRSYLMDTGKSLGQSMKTETLTGKGKALLNKVDDNAVANLPNLADKIAWIEIWNACKREVMTRRGHEFSGKQDAFLAAVGERFTEVVRATQVYDSIFAKSPLLKSKSVAVQYLVSFMNEPNVTANMAEKAVRDYRKGHKKQALRVAHVLIHSVIANNLCKSLIYAMRDDDEDETYIEKYLEAIVPGLMQDLNPLGYIPVARDVLSLAQGYDVERGDMAIVSDSINALNRVIENAWKNTEDMTEEDLAEFDKKVTKANWDLVQSIATYFGISVKNIRREIEGVLNTAHNAVSNQGSTTRLSAWDKIEESFRDSIPFMQKKITKADKLYGALMAGDEAYLDRLRGTYKSEAAYESAVIKALRENDERIHEAAQAGLAGDSAERSRIFREIKAEGKVSAALIIDAINSETNAIRNADQPDKVEGQYETYDFVAAVAEGNGNAAKIVRDDILSTYMANGKTQAEAEAAFRTDVKSGIREAYSYGDISTDAAKNMLTDYAELGEEDATVKIAYWEFSNANPGCSLGETKVMKYLELAEPAGISLKVYEQFVLETKDLADRKDAWGDVEVSKRDQVLAVIDALPLTWEQKDALYLAAGYAENKLWDVPW